MTKKITFIVCIISLALLFAVAVAAYFKLNEKSDPIAIIEESISGEKEAEEEKEPEPVLISPNLTVMDHMTLAVKTDLAIVPDYEGFGELSFSSFDEKIVTVNEDGLMTGVSPGETYVSVKLSQYENYRAWSQNILVTVTSPDISNVIFLTYDDGPSGNITPELLDVLQSYGAHATFFVIGKYADEHRDIIKRAYDEGHTIAIHTYTHDYRKVYSSTEAYIEDFDETEALIEEITGEKPRFWRFPGGSNNGYTNKASQQIIIEQLRERGYTPMDWNVSTTDAAPDYPSAETMVKKGSEYIDQVLSSGGNPVVLMHDSETKTHACDATRTFITKYGQMGYEFRGLDDYYGEGVLFLKL